MPIEPALLPDFIPGPTSDPGRGSTLATVAVVVGSLGALFCSDSLLCSDLLLCDDSGGAITLEPALYPDFDPGSGEVPGRGNTLGAVAVSVRSLTTTGA